MKKEEKVEKEKGLNEEIKKEIDMKLDEDEWKSVKCSKSKLGDIMKWKREIDEK